MKWLVVAIGLLLIASIMFIAYRALFPDGTEPAKGKAKGKRKTDRRRRKVEEKEDRDRLSAQELIGLADVMGTNVIMTDGSVVNIVEIVCINTSLMTGKEKVEIAKRTARVLSTLKSSFLILKLHRQADNTRHVDELRTLIADVEGRLRDLSANTPADKHRRSYLLARRTILSHTLDDEYLREREFGRQLQTQTYVCLKTKAGTDSTKRAHETSTQLLRRLDDNGFTSRLLATNECIDVLKAYFDEPTTPKINITPYLQIPLVSPEQWRRIDVPEFEEDPVDEGGFEIDLFGLSEVHCA
jgi:hypothetical protein